MASPKEICDFILYWRFWPPWQTSNYGQVIYKTMGINELSAYLREIKRPTDTPFDLEENNIKTIGVDVPGGCTSC